MNFFEFLFRSSIILFFAISIILHLLVFLGLASPQNMYVPVIITGIICLGTAMLNVLNKGLLKFDYFVLSILVISIFIAIIRHTFPDFM